MDRSPNAPLSPTELNSLGRVSLGVSEVPAYHRTLLISMGLVFSVDDALVLTEKGRQKLDAERSQPQPTSPQMRMGD